MIQSPEINHYPGPRHVLDLASQLSLSDTQRLATQQIYDHMHAEAIRIGELIIAQEKELDRLFATHEIEGGNLHDVVRKIARLQGELRIVHLQAHVEMKRLLSPEQIAIYDALRGYGTHGPADSSQAHQHGKHYTADAACRVRQVKPLTLPSPSIGARTKVRAQSTKKGSDLWIIKTL